MFKHVQDTMKERDKGNVYLHQIHNSSPEIEKGTGVPEQDAYEKSSSMRSDIFGNGNRPILADYMERMGKKATKEPVRNIEYGLMETKPEETSKERKVSGRKKKSGDANQRELGETNGQFLHE